MIEKFKPISCPLCGKGKLSAHADGVFKFRHGKKTFEVLGQHYAQCEECGTQGYLPGQRAENSELVKKFQSELPDYISPSDVLAVRERYSLTQNQATQIFKGGVNGFSKWERGVAFPSGATAMLLKVALRSCDAMKVLAEVACVDFPIVDNLSNAADSRGTFEIAHCTHSEYADEISVETDAGISGEYIEQWTLEKYEVNTKKSYFLN